MPGVQQTRLCGLLRDYNRGSVCTVGWCLQALSGKFCCDHKARILVKAIACACFICGKIAISETRTCTVCYQNVCSSHSVKELRSQKWQGSKCVCSKCIESLKAGREPGKRVVSVSGACRICQEASTATCESCARGICGSHTVKLSGVGIDQLTTAWGVGERTVCPTCEAVVKDKWTSDRKHNSQSEFDSHSDDSVEDLDVFLVQSTGDSPTGRYRTPLSRSHSRPSRKTSDHIADELIEQLVSSSPGRQSPLPRDRSNSRSSPVPQSLVRTVSPQKREKKPSKEQPSQATGPGIAQGFCRRSPLLIHSCKIELEFRSIGGSVRCYNCHTVNNFQAAPAGRS